MAFLSITSPDRSKCDEGGETMAIFGIELGAEEEVLLRPMATEACRLMLSRRARRVGCASTMSGRIVPSVLKAEARTKTQGLPTSMHVAGTPSKVSMMLPVGRSLPVLEPLRWSEISFRL
jgi:hypothetical protein